MKLPYFVVDAFTSRQFSGNPAGVVLLDAWPNDQILQSISAENNLSETAFLVRRGAGSYDLRWFTPRVEVDLCGHATLASAFVLSTFIEPACSEFDFATKSGELRVARVDGQFSMDFPAQPPIPVDCPQALLQGLGLRPSFVGYARDYFAVLDTEAQLLALKPDLSALSALDGLGVIVTTAGSETDFVSRAFYPKLGIPEDPVTGSAHCVLTPYWSTRLGKSELTARQISARGGELRCRLDGDRVTIYGNAVLYLEGYITVSEAALARKAA